VERERHVAKRFVQACRGVALKSSIEHAPDLAPNIMNDDCLIRHATKTAFDEVCRKLPEVAQRHKFGVLGMHDLKEKMVSKGVAFDRECRVFEVCNPQQAKEILNRAMEISTVLPCRIAVYQEGGNTVLAAIKPTLLLGLFNAPEAIAAANEVEATMATIIAEAARG
jgi:uncharacterized protein (DUF302 family)